MGWHRCSQRCSPPEKEGQIISVEEEALQTFAAKRKADEIEKELREFIIYTLGGQAWSQLIEIRGQVRKRRLEEAAKARRQKRKAFEAGIIVLALLFGFGVLGYMVSIVITQGNF